MFSTPNLILAETEVPWYIVALIFIAFIRWIIEQIRGRGGDNYVEEEQAEQDEYHERSQRHEGSGSEPASDLRKFLESLAGEEPEPEPEPERQRPTPPPVPQTQPPPVPVEAASPYKQKTIERPNLTSEEKAALERIKERQGMASRRERRKQSGGGVSLRSMLRNKANLRQAYILKEILDKPIALRDEE